MAVEEEFKMEMKDDPTALICSPMNMSAKLQNQFQEVTKNQ